MNEQDLRSRIIPTILRNTGHNGKIETEEFNTQDLIYIETYDEYYKENLRIYKNRETNTPKCTNYASNGGTTIEIATRSIPKDNRMSNKLCIEKIQKYNRRHESINSVFGICPSLRFKIEDTDKSSVTSKKIDKDKFNIKKERNEEKRYQYYILQIGAYPKTKIDNSKVDGVSLEKLYNNGNIVGELFSTGKCFTKITKNGIKLVPEFEYKGHKYIRELEGTLFASVVWRKVEPIDFIIKNWDKLPKNINPTGSEEEKYFDLRAKEAILSMQFYPNPCEKNGNMWQNSSIRGFLNGIDVRNIQDNGNSEFGAKRGGDFSGNLNFLNEAFNLEMEPITEYEVPKAETKIPDYAFNGCISLDKIVIHKNVTDIGKECFSGLTFKYLVKTENGETILCNKIPDKQKFERIIELGNILNYLPGANIDDIFENTKIDEKLIEFANKLKEHKFAIPYVYVRMLIENNMEEKFFENSDFRFFKKEFKGINEALNQFNEEEKLDFFKFARNLGCFSTNKVIDKQGRETEIIIAQKATTILRNLLKTEQMKLGNYHKLFDSMALELEVEQDFLKFISTEKIEKRKDKDNKTVERIIKLENLELLTNLEEECPGIFTKVMTDFNKANKYRNSIDENGMPRKVSKEEALKTFYYDTKYHGITEENKDIAKVLGNRGVSQKTFNQACNLREQAKKNKIPEHILDTQIAEETIVESIEKIKEETLEELDNAKEILKAIYEKQFTYEWLSKNDPHNSVMGLYCSCCGTITSIFYGRTIAKSTILAPDVQNLVVRNIKGEIIAKATMYVNKEKRYGVINDFEINSKYRKHETSTGRYASRLMEDKERKLIFDAFKRGIDAFIEEYDKENPEGTLQQLNIGMGCNRLKKEMDEYKKAEIKLNVPTEYKFQDAKSEQRIFYSRKNDRQVEGEEK